MRSILEFIVFLAVALVWAASDWLARHKQNVVFTLGLLSIVIGCALERPSLAFIVFGVLVCGLLIVGRLLAFRAPPVRKEGGDA